MKLFLCLVILVAAAGRAGANQLDALSKAAAQYHGGPETVGRIYSECLLSTVRYDVTITPDNTTYVITGDIGAMWLRDASAQVRPYLYFTDDPEVRALLRGVIAREATAILVDPYANAFNREYRVAEEKFELDSLLYPIALAWTYWKKTGDATVFTPDVKASYEKALAVMELERDHNLSRYRHRKLPTDGAGNPVGYTGMIWTGFRPSDDPAQYGYNIPEEMFAVVALGELMEIEDVVWRDKVRRDEIARLRDGVADGINDFGIVYAPAYGYVYAYEVDGLGHFNLMDDANVPSLLSAPYLGYVPSNDAIYANTRRLILSSDNPYFFTGKYAKGVGSRHTPPGFVWPLALIMEGLTTSDSAEIHDVVDALAASDIGDHLLHESFDPDDPLKYTRRNFGWPCSLFAELVLNSVLGYQPLPTAVYAGQPITPRRVGATLR